MKTLSLLLGLALPAAAFAQPAARTWTFDRDAAGTLTRRIDPACRATTYEYDGPALKKATYADGSTVAFETTAGGVRKSMTTSGWGTTRYEYDALGWPRSVSDPSGMTVSYRHDADGTLTRIELSDGWWTAYEHDALGRLATVQSPLGMVRFKYEPARRIDGRAEPRTTRTLPNGVVTTWTYDTDHRLTRLRHERDGQLIVGWSYRYDAHDRIQSIADEATGRAGVAAYDPLGQLRQIARNGEIEEAYEYDPGCSLTRATRNKEMLEFRSDDWGQLRQLGKQTVSHNALGERTAVQGNGADATYRWDGEGRLVAIRDIVYTYDGDGNLAARTKGTDRRFFVYDVSGRVPQLLAALDENRKAALHCLLAPNRLAVKGRDGGVAWFLEDHLNSVRAVVDGGRVASRLEFTAYGVPLQAADAPGGFGFAGEWRDPDTGLLFLRARWYEPRTGRFLSPDPVWGDVQRPVTLNRYAYAGNDPLNAVDPTGLNPWPPPPYFFNDPNRDFLSLRRLAPPPLFPSAARPPEWRTPDYYTLNLGFSVAKLNVTVISQTWDRYGTSHRDFFNMGIGKNPLEPHVAGRGGWMPSIDYSAAGYWMLGGKPSQATINQFLAHPSLSANLGWIDVVMSGRQKAVGVVIGSPSFGVSGDVSGLLQPLAKAFPAAGTKHPAPWANSNVGAMATALANNPYKYPSREAAEFKQADLYERLARGGGQKAFTEWAMGAEYSSPEQLRNAPRVPGSIVNSFAQYTRPPAPQPQPPMPKVGGVYLNAVADVMGEIGTVRGVHFDRESNRLILLGDGQGTATGKLRADDLAVAFRCAAAGQFPAFSIDPAPMAPEGPVMDCRYIGPVQWTHFGKVMFEADRLMKDLGRSEDEKGNKLRPKIAGFKDTFELEFAAKPKDGLQRWNRFWFVASKVEWTVSPDGATLFCSRAGVAVKTQVSAIGPDGKMVDVPGASDPSSEAFAKFLTDNYDALAREYPVLEDLRQLVQLVGLVNWLKAQMPAEAFADLAASLTPEYAATPLTTPGTSISRMEKTGTGVRTLRLYGGVDLKVEVPATAARVPALGDLAGLARKALPAGPKPALSEVRAGAALHRIVAIPLAVPSAEGSLALAATDLVLAANGEDGPALTRTYNSMASQLGPFGRGWQLLLPELVYRKKDGKVALEVTDPWRTSSTPVTAPAFTDVQQSQPRDRLTAADGSVLDFDRRGRLIRHVRGTEEWALTYGGDRLRKIERRKDGKPDGALELTYNSAGLVERAQAGPRAAAYEYDARHRLVAVRVGDRTIAYGYDAHDRIVSVKGIGADRAFAYGPDGRVLGGDSADPFASFRRDALPNSKTRLTKPGSPEFTLGAAGQVERIEQNGLAIAWTETARGTTGDVFDGTTRVARVQYDAATRRVTVDGANGKTSTFALRLDGTIASGEIRAGDSVAAVAFDARGNPIGVTDPAGGEYRLADAVGNSRELTTPVGPFSVQTDGKGQGVQIRSPSGRVWSWGADAGSGLKRVAEQSGGTTREWTQTPPNTWTVRENDQPIATVRVDAADRVVESRAANGVAVAAKHGPGGSVITTADKRHLLVRRDAAGQVVEFREYAANTAAPRLPLADLTGQSTVKEKLEKLPAQIKPKR